MRWVFAVLLVLSPAILYGIGLLITAIMSAYYRRPCPACGERGLKWVNGLRATILINGQRAPDYWAYYDCERCGVHFKVHHGEWSIEERAA